MHLHKRDAHRRRHRPLARHAEHTGRLRPHYVRFERAGRLVDLGPVLANQRLQQPQRTSVFCFFGFFGSEGAVAAAAAASASASSRSSALAAAILALATTAATTARVSPVTSGVLSS